MTDAVASFHEAIRLDPSNAQFHLSLGANLALQGQTGEAISWVQEALRLRPGFAEAHYQLGLIHGSLGQLDTALLQFQLALRVNNELGDAADQLEKLLAAANGDLIQNQRRLHLFARGHCNLGIVRSKEGKLDDAIAHYRWALQLLPDDADAHHSLGAALQQRQQLTEAIECYREALRCRPEFAESFCNLGYALMDQGDFAEALTNLDQSVRLKPDFAEAHGTRSQLRLLLGDFEQGWPEYEWRWRQPGVQPRGFREQLWNGEGLDGRTILIHAEQGLGDTIQFIRYAALVKQRGGRVLVECQPGLRRLLGGVAGIDALFVQGSRLPAFDTQAPLLSLPGILRTRIDTIPKTVPYLHADPKLVTHWQRQLKPHRGLKVGIAWQGNPVFREDRQRSIPLTGFAALANVRGVQLISLQKGPGTEQLAELTGDFRVLDLASSLDKASGPFMDTAAIMKGLDLVICSDSAVAHLAG
ncbi:MAG TPA: tetratricopeptide repeat-containing glycosyltransferase family protein, partial [Gemmataceae bacterium]|nr:tetratricopeptide repeat-containing glycosyltransferase family protein [Gemmataceae bacterium]